MRTKKEGRYRVFGVMDSAPSEQFGIHPKGSLSWHTTAVAIAATEQVLTECIEGMLRGADRNFSLSQWKQKRNRLTFGKRLCIALKPYLEDSSLAFSLYSAQERFIAANLDQMKAFLGVQWVHKLVEADGSEWAFFTIQLEDGFRFPRLRWHQVLPLIWIAYGISHLYQFSSQVAQANRRKAPIWSLLSDRIAADTNKSHPRGELLMALLNSRCKHIKSIEFSAEHDSLSDKLADTLAGFGTECMERQNEPEWAELRQRLQDLPNVHWIQNEKTAQ